MVIPITCCCVVVIFFIWLFFAQTYEKYFIDIQLLLHRFRYKHKTFYEWLCVSTRKNLSINVCNNCLQTVRFVLNIPWTMKTIILVGSGKCLIYLNKKPYFILDISNHCSQIFLNCC